tara:strand:- start:45 stop:1037 length:993 start_codon:yes stop_codon:yes gene_type:complete
MVRRPTTNSNSQRGGRPGTHSGPASPITPGAGGGPPITDGSQMDPSDDTVGTPYIPPPGHGFAYFATVEYNEYNCGISANWSYGLIIGGGGYTSNMYIHSQTTQKVVTGQSDKFNHKQGKCFGTLKEAEDWIDWDLNWMWTSTGYNTSFRWWIPKPGAPGFGEAGTNNPPPGTTLTEADLVGVSPGSGRWSLRGAESTYKSLPGGKLLEGTHPGGNDYPGAGGGNSTWGDQGQGLRRPEWYWNYHRISFDKTFYANAFFQLEAMETVTSNIAVINVAAGAQCPADFEEVTLECMKPIQDISVTPDPKKLEESIDPTSYDNCLSPGVIDTL